VVPFNEVIRPLLRIVEEGIQGADRPIRFVVHGHAGELPAEIATPLSIVLVELLQNSVEHGYPIDPQDKSTTGSVIVTFERTAEVLRVVVQDDGVGFPSGFSLSTTRSLGLTIVRTLITSELGGVISTSNNNGAVVDLRLGLPFDENPPLLTN
jgi:two-component system, sensor histidine kinase PdtaS